MAAGVVVLYIWQSSNCLCYGDAGRIILQLFILHDPWTVYDKLIFQLIRYWNCYNGRSLCPVDIMQEHFAWNLLGCDERLYITNSQFVNVPL